MLKVFFEILFWIIFFLIVFHYVGFSVLVFILNQFFKKNHVNGDENNDNMPSVSLIIAAYNEEKIIKQKLLNDLKLDYPHNKIEIIVVSDGSSDNTPHLVESLSDKNIISLFQPKRKGKTAALNRAVRIAKNEILIFSDANSFFNKDAIKKLVRHFSDDSIGGVCGQKSILQSADRKASAGDRLYWLYESKLKQAESNLGSIPAADGEIFALRKSLYSEIPEFIINDDLALTLEIIKNKKRIIFDIEAITAEAASMTLQDDFNVKARMVYGSLQIQFIYKKYLNPFKSWFGFQYLSHKVLRHYMWMLLIAIFILNLTILIFSVNTFYTLFFVLQCAFYIFAIIGLLLDKLNVHSILFYLPYYYCNVNFAAAKGFTFFINQKSNVDIWKKAQR